MRPLPSPFVCQRGWRSAQRRGGARLLVAVHLLVIVSLLFSTAAAAMPLSKPGSRAVDATQRTLARTRPSVTGTNQQQPILSLAMTANPEAAAIGERVLLRSEVMNLDSQDVTLTYDAENRLTAMSGSVTASYVYDGDNKRVKETIGGVTWVFVGNTYEVDNGTVKKYYYAGNVRVAERSGGVLFFLLSDHLGSTALTLDSSGNRLDPNIELRYYPYGGVRYNPGGQVTTYRFTGQRWDSGAALYFYQSRWYDPAVGRFLAADTIVPNPGNPVALNRYLYVSGNPLRYTDPTGHRECEDADCHETWPARPPKPPLPFGIPPHAGPTTTPIITTYYTPQYNPQPDAQGNPADNPNLWVDRSRGSPRRDAALQGSVVVNGQIWKYILATDNFVARGPLRGNGVPVVGGWVVPPEDLGKTPDGRSILRVTAAVAHSCPHNVHCDLEPFFEPAYRRGAKPEYTIYLVTDGNVLIVTPLDTGYGLAANQIDIYMGVSSTKPTWRWGSNEHPQAYIAPY